MLLRASPNRLAVVPQGGEASVKVIDFSTPQGATYPLAHDGPVGDLGFDPTGRFLFTVSGAADATPALRTYEILENGPPLLRQSRALGAGNKVTPTDDSFFAVTGPAAVQRGSAVPRRVRRERGRAS